MKQFQLKDDQFVSEDSSYSLSKEMKEWCEKNPKDSYGEEDFVVIDECVNSLVCQMADKCQGCKKVAYPVGSKYVHHLSRISKPVEKDLESSSSATIDSGCDAVRSSFGNTDEQDLENHD